MPFQSRRLAFGRPSVASVVPTLSLAAKRAGYNDVMHAAVLRGDTCSTMRRLPRARSVGSNSQSVRKKVVTTTLQYDSNGNLIQKTTDGTTSTFSWDQNGNLVQKTTDGITTTYVSDHANHLTELDERWPSRLVAATSENCLRACAHHRASKRHHKCYFK
jgi:YD repeat-containing protein